MKRLFDIINEAKLHREKWGWEIEGTVAEIIHYLKKCPPEKECIATVPDEITGTVNEVIQKISNLIRLKKLSPEAECIADVTFRSDNHINFNPA